LQDAELNNKLTQLDAEIRASNELLLKLRDPGNTIKDQKELNEKGLQIAKAEASLRSNQLQKKELLRLNNADSNRPGWFSIVAPPFSTARATDHTQEWTVLDPDFREKFNNQYVKPSDPILRLGDTNGSFEVETKIPEKHIGQVKKAFNAAEADPKLDVDLLVMSDPTRKFRGVLYKSRVAGEATPNRDDHNESAPVVIAYISLDDPSIPADQRVPRELITTGVEVHAKVLCGDHAMGYSLFYGLWEFLYEKVVFFF
jgi:hypothetical protein